MAHTKADPVKEWVKRYFRFEAAERLRAQNLLETAGEIEAILRGNGSGETKRKAPGRPRTQRSITESTAAVSG